MNLLFSKKLYILLITVIFIFNITISISAADDDSTNDKKTFILDEVIVTAKKTAEDPFLSNRSVSVLGKKDLSAKSPRTTPEALMEVPGVFVQKTNHAGGSPIVRGLIGPQVLITIDGVRLNNSVYRTGPLQYLNMVDSLSINKIEVLRGPGSVLYGSDAMGGVVQVFPINSSPYRNNKSFSYNGLFLTRYESADNGLKSHGHFQGGDGNFGIAAGVTKQKVGDIKAGGDIDEQPYSGYDHTSAFSNMEYTVENGFFTGWRFSLNYLGAIVDDAGRTDKLIDKKKLSMYYDRVNLIYGRIHMPLKAINTDGDITISYQDFAEEKEDISLEDNLETKIDSTLNKTAVGTAGIDVKYITSLLKSRIQIQYGGMWYHDSVNSSQYKKTDYYGTSTKTEISGYPDGSTYDNYGAYIMIEEHFFTFGNHKFEFDTGYRFHGMMGNAPAIDNMPSVEISDNGHVFMGSAKYLFKKNAIVAFTFSQGFRAPNLQEAVMLADTGKYFHIPNDNLKPEKSDTYELLTRIKIWKIIFQATGYYSDITDLIDRENTTWEGNSQVDGTDVAWNVNSGKAYIYGTEGNCSILLPHDISILGNITYTYGKKTDGDGDDFEFYYTRIPPLYGQGTIHWDFTSSKKINGFLESYIRGTARQDKLSPEDESDARIPEGGTPAWWTLNFRSGLVISKNYRIITTFENILNKEYKYHASGVYAPGFNMIVTLEATF
jgi:outer membrane cobalamin receptor